MSTARAVLRRIRGVHSDETPTGPCCLVGEKRCELSPRRILDALGETVVMHHPIDRQIFDRDQIKLVDEAAALLVGEVAPPPGDALMHASHNPAPLRTLRRALLDLRETPLGSRQRTFVAAEEAQVLYWLTFRGHSKGLQAHIQAHFSPSRWQWTRLGTLAREADVPFAGAAALDGGRLGRALQRAMQDDFHQPDVHHTQPPRLGVQMAAHRHLREGEAIIAAPASKTRITWRLAGFDPAEERLEGQINAHGHVLQPLRRHPRQRRTLRF